MPKRRKTNKHLPPRVYQKHGAYYYVNTENKWIKIGAGFAEAMANWSKIVDQGQKTTTMHQLFTRYMTEVAPLKSKASYEKNIYQMQHLIKCFGDMLPDDITPVDIYKYLDVRGKSAPVSANREKSLLSHVFSFAIRWGVIQSNPCKLVTRLPEKPRERYIEDWEYHEVRECAPIVIQLLMDFAYLTGQRIGDILEIKLSDLTDEGIKIEQNKTKTKILIEWTEELRSCVDEIMIKLRRSKIHSFTLFCNTKGLPFTYEAFSTLWLKAMNKALQKGELKERFTFHDIRAKSSSDSGNRIEASNLLGHADIRMTERVYNRKYRKVRPIK